MRAIRAHPRHVPGNSAQPRSAETKLTACGPANPPALSDRRQPADGADGTPCGAGVVVEARAFGAVDGLVADVGREPVHAEAESTSTRAVATVPRAIQT
ncbi:MAG TPA: hypothetical protein VGH30_04160 [Jatrophihabitantaceae bacterium]